MSYFATFDYTNGYPPIQGWTDHLPDGYVIVDWHTTPHPWPDRIAYEHPNGTANNPPATLD